MKHTVKTYGEAEAGCWFDGARGIYVGDAIIKLAIKHGWECDVPGASAPVWASSPSWAEHEHYHEITDEAEAFMQQFEAPGFYFAFSDGDWGLWPINAESEFEL